MPMPSHTMTHSYQLPITVLLEIMRESKASMLLRTSFTTPAPGAPADVLQETLAEIIIEHGVVCSCHIRSRNSGQLLYQYRDALRFLQTAGTLEWQVQPRYPLSAAEGVGPKTAFATMDHEESMLVPRPLASVHEVALASLPVRVRQVSLLINGQRSPSEIGHLLRLLPQEAGHLTSILHERRLIAWRAKSS